MEIAKTIAPVCLAIIMFGLGLGLTTSDFTRVVKKPTIKSRGILSSLVKSDTVRPRPKPNIIIARHTGAIVFAISIILTNL